jgi:hypothetical protein
LSKLEHPRILKFMGVVFETNAPLLLVSEFMPGGDVINFISEQ